MILDTCALLWLATLLVVLHASGFSSRLPRFPMISAMRCSFFRMSATSWAGGNRPSPAANRPPCGGRLFLETLFQPQCTPMP